MSGNIVQKQEFLKGALNIHNADVHTFIVNRQFVRYTGTTSNINAAVTAGDTSVTVVSDTSFSVGDFVSITEGNTEETNFAVVSAKPGSNVLTLDRPLDNSYTTAGTVELVRGNLASSSASLGSPLIYEVRPPSDAIWHITRLLVTITDAPQPADDLFHNLSALSHGVTFRENKVQKRILTNWKTNADMIEDSFDVAYAEKAGGGSDWGVRVRWTLKNADTISRLNGFAGEKLEVLVQDDLTALDDMQVKAQGHIEGD